MTERSTPGSAAVADLPESTKPSPPTVSVLKRFLLGLLWTPFGLVFFYLFMVFLSSISKGLNLDRLAQNGWSRAASRHTGAVTAPVFALFLMMPPSSLWSHFMALLVCCAHFAHLVIISSDLHVYHDRVVAHKMFRLETTHPIFRVLPMWTAHVVGTIGFFAMLIISSERCYGPSLGRRQRKLPFLSRICCAWIWAVFNLWFLDRLLNAILARKSQEEILYPIYFIAILLIGAVVAVKRERRSDVQVTASEKKTN